jgi:hypothetical protein
VIQSTLLRAGGLGEGVVRRAEHGDKEFDRLHLARGRIHDRWPQAGVVDEGFLAGRVHLPHREPLPRPPRAIPVAERRVAVPGRLRGQVFDVQELQGDPGPTELPVNQGQVRLGQGPVDLRWRGAVQCPLQGVVGQAFDGLPRQLLGTGAADRRRHRAGTHPQTPRRFPVATLGHPLQPQDLSNLLHRQSLRRHPLPVSPMGQRADRRADAQRRPR